VQLIAEFCQNHNGSFDTLRRMIAAAAEGGATHGKIQTIFADDLSFRPEFDDGAVRSDGKVLTIKRPYEPEYQRLKGLELSYEEHRLFGEECRAAGIEPMTTAFTLTALPRLEELGWRTVKVASYDCGSLPLIKALAARFESLIVSTGASTDEEIESTAEYLRSAGRDFSLLHCVTLYPTPLNEMHLSRLGYLSQFTPKVGLSDHTLVARDGVKAALAAIHAGASVIERHFTVLEPGETRDGAVSVTKDHLREIRSFAKLGRSEQEEYLREHVPEFRAMHGVPSRALSHQELLNRAYYRGRFANKVGGRQIYNWDCEAESLLDAQVRRSYG
jgi:N,N'-diacetyllegionaminate synthase